MEVSPLVDDRVFKELDAASYDALAEEYGRFIELLAAPLALEVCRLAGIAAGDHVLDIGCGTGIASRRAASLVGAGGRVVGVDLSVGMLAAATRRSAPDLASGVLQFERMDAEALELDDGSFDSVVSLCAVLHFPRIDRALAEMRRVLRPGGALVVSFGAGRPAALLPLARHAAGRGRSRIRNRLRPELRAPALLLRLAGEELPGTADDVLTTWAGNSPRSRLVKHVEAAGFADVSSSWRGHEVPFGSVAELWDAQLAIVTEIRKRVAEADPSTVERVRARFEADADRVLSRGGRLVYPYGASFVRAIAPPL